MRYMVISLTPYLSASFFIVSWRLLLDSIYGRDYPVVQGTVLVVAVAFVLVNLAIDLLYAVLDPRIAYV